MKEKEKNEAVRYSSGKIAFELIPMEWMWGLAHAMSYGNEKYFPRNWEKGMAWSRMVGSAFRHFVKFLSGERYDSESGVHHLVHAAWNVLALLSYDLRGLGENDLPNFAGAEGMDLMQKIVDPGNPRAMKFMQEQFPYLEDRDFSPCA